jgi:hypothetical protein
MESIRRKVMIPASLDKEPDAVSEVLGQTRSSLIAKALACYFDILDLDMARERARLLDAGKTRPLTPAQIRKVLGVQAVSWVLEHDPADLKDLKRIDRQDQRFILDSLDKFAENNSRA